MSDPQVRPRVSVIIPAYRAEESLPRIVEQLMAQTVRPFEVILVCDGVADETPDVAASLSRLHDSVVALVLPENVGVARARDAGVRSVQGDFVLFLDADDTMPETAIEHLAGAAETTSSDVVIGQASALLPDGRLDYAIAAPVGTGTVSGVAAFSLLLRGTVTGHLWNKLVRLSVLEQCLPFAVSEVHSDLSIVARVMSRARTVTFVDQPVYTYHATPGSILKSGRRRGASLDVIAGVVRESADLVDARLATSSDYRYFVLKHIGLSRLKDAVLGPYDAATSARLASDARRALSWRDLPPALRLRDARTAATLIIAKISLSLYRRLMTRGRDSTGSRSHRIMDIVAKESV
ncbi:glycosyltransferase family A protein [Microbacterium sp. NPDC064584]|uniref:glycosyltransferase family 2 protein n=1 Tax=Microbacterium sp. NPDC064584 TaxID=3155817 RepID=UPI003420EACF